MKHELSFPHRLVKMPHHKTESEEDGGPHLLLKYIFQSLLVLFHMKNEVNDAIGFGKVVNSREKKKMWKTPSSFWPVTW